VGDIIKQDLSGILKIIEVKEGEVNRKAIDIIKAEARANDDKVDFEKLKRSYGVHLAEQIMRTSKQFATGAHIEEIINTGMGQDPRTGDAIIIRSPSRKPVSYAWELAELVLGLDKKAWNYTVFDDALMVGCYIGV
jgi:hypothetical protein